MATVGVKELIQFDSKRITFTTVHMIQMQVNNTDTKI